ncbi:MAG: adenylate kinase family protein [Promethearchaeota archaeon]
MKIVIISGTPGTGKTSVSKKITEKINARMISLNELAISKNLIISYDQKRDTNIIDAKKIIDQVEILIQKHSQGNIEVLIIESHFSDIIPNDLIDYPIVLRCHPDELMKRLKERDYKTEKLIENAQAEILGNCMNFMIKKNMGKEIIEINTTNLNVKSIAEIIIHIIQDNKYMEKFSKLKVDWLEKLFQENRLEDFFD